MKQRGRDIGIALLLLSLGAYGLRTVSDEDRWINPDFVPRTAMLKESNLILPPITARDIEVLGTVAPESMSEELLAETPTAPLQARKPSAILPFVTEEINENASKPKRYGSIGITPRFTYARLDSIDRSSLGTASFLTNLNIGLDFSWVQHWTDFFQTNLHGGFLKEAFTSDTGLKTVQNAEHTISNIGIGAMYSKFVDLSLNFDMTQRDFIRATSANNLVFDAVPIPQLSLGLSVPLINLDPFTLSLNGSYAYLFGTKGVSYSVEHGTYYQAGLTLSEAIGQKLHLDGGFWYGQANQNTSAETQTIKEVGASIGLKFSFEPSQAKAKEEKTP